MESWVQTIGAAPIATGFFAMGCVILLMARHILKQQEMIVSLQRECFAEVTKLTIATSAALSSNGQAMTAVGAGMASAQRAMEVATAVIERTGR